VAGRGEEKEEQKASVEEPVLTLCCALFARCAANNGATEGGMRRLLPHVSPLFCVLAGRRLYAWTRVMAWIRYHIRRDDVETLTMRYYTAFR